jgi:PhnB protein
MKAINPYINFNGNCEEAFNFYKSVFGGEFTSFQRFNEMPDDVPPEMRPKESEGNKVMHVTLPLEEEHILMGSDYPENMSDQIQAGNNFSVSIDAESEEEAKRIFQELSEGGKVIMPLAETFWGSLYGMFTDKFGIQWMVSYAYE